MKNSKRVLYLETSTENTIGGSHHSLYQLTKRVVDFDIVPVVVFYEENKLVDQFVEIGCEVHVFRYPKRFNFFKASKVRLFKYINSMVYFLYLTLFCAIKNSLWIKRNNIELIHLNNNPFSMDWVFASKICRIPCVAHQRGIRTSLDRSEIYLANSVDRVICISNYVWRSLQNCGCSAENFSLVHNGIDIENFKAPSSKLSVKSNLNIKENSFVVGMVGNIKEWKGQHVLIEALPQLLTHIPNLVVIFVGEFDRHNDSYRARLIKRMEQLNLSELVIFTGYTPNVKLFMSAMDIVVHASTEPEPFGRVIIEAMAMQKLIIASNGGGAKEIVDHLETGVLFEPGDAKSLASFIIEYACNPEAALTLSVNARNKVVDSFNIEVNVEKTIEIYKLAGMKTNNHL